MRTATAVIAVTLALVSLLVTAAISVGSRDPAPAVALAARIHFHSALPRPRLGDLDSLKRAGELRILARSTERGPAVSAAERQFIDQFAASEGLRPVWIGAPIPQLKDYLDRGRADILVGSTPRAAEPAGLLHTLAWGTTQQYVVGRADTGDVRREGDLYTRQVAIKRSSPAWAGLARAAREHATMEIVEIPEETGLDKVLHRVASGKYDLAVVESMAVDAMLPRYPGLSVAYKLGAPQPRTWAVREGAVALRDSLNRYLNVSHLELGPARVYRDDLPGLHYRHMLRLITYGSPVNCFFERGRFKGFEYELMRRFAENHGMRLEVVIADSYDDMVRLLKEGKGDVIGASLPTGSYAGESQVAYTRPYNYAAPVIVGRDNDPAITGAQDLAGRRIVVPEESPYRELLSVLQRQGSGIQVVSAETGVNTETALFRVANGLYDLTIIPSDQVKAELARQMNLKTELTLAEPAPLSWAVRAANKKLQAALNDFLDREVHGGFYNVLYARYVDHPAIHNGDARLLTDVDRLSPYDKIVREYADEYGFDWRLIVAQMFQESHFDPNARSYAGAEGLMQLLPGTAQLIGATNIEVPANSIAAGVRYLSYLRGEFEDNLLLEDRTWFTLAAYNAGLNRVQRARRLAAEMHLDQNRWFDNVERAMIRLSAPYEKDGDMVTDCRCGQTVVYVRDIRTRYNSYVRLTRSAQPALARQANATEPLPSTGS